MMVPGMEGKEEVSGGKVSFICGENEGQPWIPWLRFCNLISSFSVYKSDHWGQQAHRSLKWKVLVLMISDKGCLLLESPER